MGIYNDLIYIESEIIPLYSRFVSDLHDITGFFERMLSFFDTGMTKKSREQEGVVAQLSDLVISFRESMNEIIYSDEELKKHIGAAKKDITRQALEHIEEDIRKMHFFEERIVKQMTGCATLFQSLGRLSNDATRLEISRYLTRRESFIKKYSLNDLYLGLARRIYNDLLIMKNYRSGRPISEILGMGYRHKINTSIVLKNHKVELHFRNKVDFASDTIADSGSKMDIVSYIKSECNSKLKSSPANDVSLIKVKGMSARDMEYAVLDIVKNTFVGVIDKESDIINTGMKRLNITLVEDQGHVGYYDPKKSDFLECFIEISINKELLTALESGQTTLSENSDSYKYIMHELRHAYEYWANNHDTSDSALKTLAKKMFGNSINTNAPALSKILLECREEGLANISELFMIHDDQYGPNITLSFGKPDITGFIRLVNNQSLSVKIVEKNYDSGIIHHIALMMAAIIFLDSTNGRFEYSRQIQGIRNPKSIRLASKEMIDELLNGKVYALSAPRAVLEKETGNFIKKLSLMPPEMFLEKYEIACRNFGMTPVMSKMNFLAQTSRTVR